MLGLMLRAFGVVFLTGCLAQATAAISPTPSGTGTLTCGQIVETCDSQCGDPLCVRRCGDQGTPDAAQQHAALVECAQGNRCTDEACIRSNCATEADTCGGPPAAATEGAPGATP